MKSERNDHISDVKLSRKLYYLRIFDSNAEKTEYLLEFKNVVY